jgi:hypothetical protein
LQAKLRGLFADETPVLSWHPNRPPNPQA